MEQVEEDTNNGKTFSAHGLGEPVLLKCLQYPKQSADLMQPLSEHQQHFSQN